MTAQRNGMFFGRNVYETLKALDCDDARGRFMMELFSYGMEGVEPDFGGDPLMEIAFINIKPFIDSSASRAAASRENGKKGGRPRKGRGAGTSSAADADVPENLDGNLGENLENLDSVGFDVSQRNLENLDGNLENLAENLGNPPYNKNTNTNTNTNGNTNSNSKREEEKIQKRRRRGRVSKFRRKADVSPLFDEAEDGEGGWLDERE